MLIETLRPAVRPIDEPVYVGKCKNCGTIVRFTERYLLQNQARILARAILCPTEGCHAEVAAHRPHTVWGKRILAELD